MSVAYGHQMIGWADSRFAYRFAGGPPPPRPPKSGRAHARRERHGWYRHVLAFVVGTALLLGGAALVGDASRAEALLAWIPRWTLALVIDFGWSFSYTLWPLKASAAERLADRDAERVSAGPGGTVLGDDRGLATADSRRAPCLDRG